MKKTAIHITAILTVLALASCQNGASKPGSAPGAAAPATTVQGPGDSGGGGNTCNGRMIETYRVDITSLPEYQQFLKPIFEKLQNENKTNQAPLLLTLTPTSKNWYFVDCHLDDIPRETNGLYLERTEQVALHRSREIFVDNSLYNKMPIEEKAKLLLHEMLMSYYLMKYMPIQELCSLMPTCSNSDSYKRVEKWKMFAAQPYRKLNDPDHQRIRALTAWVWEHKDSITREEFRTASIKNDFDKRFQWLNGSTDPKETQIPINLLVKMFKKYQWGHLFPPFCGFKKDTLASSSTCSTAVAVGTPANVEMDSRFSPRLGELLINLTITRASDNKVVKETFSLKYLDEAVKVRKMQWGEIFNIAPINLQSVNRPGAPGVAIQEGARSRDLIIYLSLQNPEEPEIFQMSLYTMIWYAFEDKIEERDGKRYQRTYGLQMVSEEDSDTLFSEKDIPVEINYGVDKTIVKEVELSKPATTSLPAVPPSN